VKKGVEKNYPQSVYSGVTLKQVVAPRFRTGVLTLDVILGGGIPMGKFFIPFGNKQSGKSTLSLKIAGSFLKTFTNKSVVWCDMEHAFEEPWANNFIYDPKRFHLLKPDYGEQAVDMTFEMMCADDAGLLVFDSLGAIVPTAEAEGDASDSHFALQTKLINRLSRKLIPLVSQSVKQGNPKTVIFINQVRANIGAQGFGAQTKQTGGFYLGHLISADLRCYRKEVKQAKGLPTMSVHSFTLDKNRVGLPKRSGEFSFFLRDYGGYKAGQFEESKAILSLGRNTGIIAKDGAKWTTGTEKFPTLNAIMDAIKQDSRLRESLKTDILKECIKNPESATQGGE
jgi:protein RecA